MGRGFLSTFGAPMAVEETGAIGTGDDFWYEAAGSMSGSGLPISMDGALRVAAAYACVHLRASIIGAVPLRMYQYVDDPTDGGKFPLRKKKQLAPNHPINELLEHQPNKWQTAFDFKAMMSTYLDIRGNAYAEIVAGPRGFADSLEPMHPDRVTVERLSDMTLRYRYTDEFGKQKILLGEEVLHLRNAIPRNFLGISTVNYAKETLGLALSAESHGAKTFANGARPSGVISIDGNLDEPNFKRLQSQFSAAFSGQGNWMKTPILEKGMKFEGVAMTSEETQFIESRQFSIEEICRWFNVPPVLLHHTTNTTSWGTGVEAIMLAFVRNGLTPTFANWKAVIRRDLILAPNIYFADFDADFLTAGDSKAKAGFYSQLVLNGILTRNEARQALGYDPLDGLDDPLTPTNTSTSDGLPGNGGDKRNQPVDQ